MRHHSVNIDHEAFAEPLTVTGILYDADPDVGAPAHFDIDDVTVDDINITHLLSWDTLYRLADDAFEFIMETER